MNVTCFKLAIALSMFTMQFELFATRYFVVAFDFWFDEGCVSFCTGLVVGTTRNGVHILPDGKLKATLKKNVDVCME